MRKLIKLILIMFLLLAAGSWLRTADAAEVPHRINYQGKLTDASGAPLNGTYKLTFRIYDDQNAGKLLWEEIYSAASIQKGIFSVMLGSVTNLDLTFDKSYFLAIQVGEDEPMTPRQRITSAGYAYMAENVLSLPKGLIVMWSGTIADIPSGWRLCDGTNGTPDLRDKFIVGAGSAYAVAATGGEAMHRLTEDEMPTHSHTYSKAKGDQGHAGGSGTSGQTVANSTDSTGSTGGGQPHNNLPPYYALAYIMKL